VPHVLLWLFWFGGDHPDHLCGSLAVPSECLARSERPHTAEEHGFAGALTRLPGSVTSLSYDGLDRVISRNTNGSTTGDCTAATPTARPAPSTPAAASRSPSSRCPAAVTVTVQAAGNTWSCPDLHGNYAVTTDSNGAPQVSPATYDPWGHLTAGSQPVSNAAGGSELGASGADGKITDTAGGIITSASPAVLPRRWSPP
jgi:YD repeat-containing protein